ncbi:MAG: FtsQ-type POTRA domain-containing protein [Pseudanabaenaceae cyanobacterium]
MMTAAPQKPRLDEPELDVFAIDYGARRRQRRQQQRRRALVGFWRLCAFGTLAAGAYWLTDRPEWVLRDRQQIEVRGNQAVPTPLIQNALGITAPKPIFRVDPKALAQRVQALGPVRSASVHRQLFPAKLVVEVAEREPVARFQAQGRSGAVDAEGVWLDPQTYRPHQWPKLALLADTAFRQQAWPRLYERLQRSPVAITEVDARDPGNLLLTLATGARVRCGNFQPDRLQQQLQKLDSLRQLPALAQKGVVLDLVDPERPLLVVPKAPKETVH